MQCIEQTEGHKTFPLLYCLVLGMKVLLIPSIKHQTASRVQIDFISFILSYPQADAKFGFLQLEIETENNLSLFKTGTFEI